MGRADAVIKSAGHLIQPFEVESALTEHATVAEARVIGRPDPVAGSVVDECVSLRPGVRRLRIWNGSCWPSAATRWARRRTEGDRLRPEPAQDRNGKVMHRLLRAREIGFPVGDLSTLEGSA